MSTCVTFGFCEEDHTLPKTADDLHMSHDKRDPGLAVLRTDFVIDNDESMISIQDSIDWNIPVLEMPAFLQTLRAEVDRIESEAARFIAAVHPLSRYTEPGEPELAGIGGGL